MSVTARRLRATRSPFGVPPLGGMTHASPNRRPNLGVAETGHEEERRATKRHKRVVDRQSHTLQVVLCWSAFARLTESRHARIALFGSNLRAVWPSLDNVGRLSESFKWGRRETDRTNEPRKDRIVGQRGTRKNESPPRPRHAFNRSPAIREDS